MEDRCGEGLVPNVLLATRQKVKESIFRAEGSKPALSRGDLGLPRGPADPWKDLLLFVAAVPFRGWRCAEERAGRGPRGAPQAEGDR